MVLGFWLKLGWKILCGSSGSARDTAKHQWQKTLAGCSEQNSRKHILLSDETKINLFGSEGVQRVWQEPSHDFHTECITVLTVKHRGGSLMIWGYKSAKVSGDIAFLDALGWTKIPDKVTLRFQEPVRRGTVQNKTEFLCHKNDI